ncbi:hypothetical protein HY025_05295 [Candidatus Daviesbacteria bacterium]|nr:hypothetical protein [Candidatus Daviesbacteria bacterium]
MKKLFIQIVSFLGLLPLLFLSPTLTFASPRLTDLGTYNGRSIRVNSSNINNHVVGSCIVDAIGDSHACFYNGTTWQDLGNFAKDFSSALSINDFDQIVGYGLDTTNTPRAFLWDKGVVKDLGGLSTLGSIAVAINNKGQIVGYSSMPQNHNHATLWENGQIKDLGTLPGGSTSGASAINDQGDIVGTSDTTSFNQHMFSYRNNQMADLGTLKANTSPLAINNQRQIVGFTTDSPGVDDSAFEYQNGSFVNLPWTSGNPSWANDINNHGVAVGFGYTAPQGGPRHATLWMNNSVTDLGGLSTIHEGSVASSVNDNGVIAGQSQDDSGIIHAVLWTQN